MQLPEYITSKWIDSLGNDSLLDAESNLHQIFSALEQEEKARGGANYSMMHGSADLMAAWDRWSRVSTAVRARGLHRRRERER
jgi:hypothetical protein